MNEHIIVVTDDSFEKDVLKSEIPVLVDYWADWCSPCKQIAPILDDIAPEYVGKVKIAKLNIDDNPKTPVKYGVRGIPTMILFKDGQVYDQITGAVPKSVIEEIIKKALGQ